MNKSMARWLRRDIGILVLPPDPDAYKAVVYEVSPFLRLINRFTG